jgi:hypothetical protein
VAYTYPVAYPYYYPTVAYRPVWRGCFARPAYPYYAGYYGYGYYPGYWW